MLPDLSRFLRESIYIFFFSWYMGAFAIVVLRRLNVSEGIDAWLLWRDCCPDPQEADNKNVSMVKIMMLGIIFIGVFD